MSDERPEGHRSIADHILSIALVLTICIAFSVTVFVVSAPKENEHFTDFFVLDQKMTAVKYPYDMNTGSEYPVYLGVGNHEQQNTSYRIEIWNLVTEFNNATNTSELTRMDYSDALLFSLSDNRTTVFPYNMSFKKNGYNQVEFLLFKDNMTAPNTTGTDRINASYRDLYLRVHVI